VNDIAVIHLVNGGFTIVDADLFPELNKERWFRNSAGYAYRQWNRQGKVDCEWMHNRVNQTPQGFIGDHINRCKFDNTRRNIRTSNKSLNSLNGKGTGVSFHKASGLWRARIANRKCKYFQTQAEAIEAREKMKAEEFETFALSVAHSSSSYVPVVKPPKQQRKSIPMIREECVDGDIARIPLLRGGHTIIDADLFDELSKFPWRRADNNYVACWIRDESGNWKYVYLSQMVHKASSGCIGDHINRNPLDNRRCNLRDATSSQNKANTAKSKGEYHSEFKGVTWHKGQGKWMVTIGVNGKHIHLGYFRSEIQAMSEYNKAAKAAFGEFACLNVLR